MTSSQITSDHATPPRPAALLSERQLAARWGVAPGSLANARSRGCSPVPYTKVLSRVRYRLADIEAYEVAQSIAA